MCFGSCPLRHVCQAKHSCQGGVLAAVPLVGSVAGWEGGQPSRCCLVIFVNTNFVRKISSRAAVCLYYSQLGGAVCSHMWPDCHCIPSCVPLGVIVPLSSWGIVLGGGFCGAQIPTVRLGSRAILLPGWRMLPLAQICNGVDPTTCQLLLLRC